jgi:hypothetical protein
MERRADVVEHFSASLGEEYEIIVSPEQTGKIAITVAKEAGFES